jgi:hypothetical protein
LAFTGRAADLIQFFLRRQPPGDQTPAVIEHSRMAFVAQNFFKLVGIVPGENRFAQRAIEPDKLRYQHPALKSRAETFVTAAGPEAACIELAFALITKPADKPLIEDR